MNFPGRRLVLFTLLTAFLPLGGCSRRPAPILEADPELVAELQASGMSGDAAHELAIAWEVMTEGGGVSVMLPFFESEDIRVATSAVLVAADWDPEATVSAISSAAQLSPGHRDALYGVLALVPSQALVEALVEEAGHQATRAPAGLLVALMALTGEPAKTPDEWVSWWAEVGEDYEGHTFEDPAQQLAKLQVAAASLNVDAIAKVINKLSDQNANPLGGLANMFNRYTEALDAARVVQLSPDVQIADEHFRFGRLQAAMRDYESILATNPTDQRSRYLLACLLLETGQAARASELFLQIYEAEPEVTSALFLARLSERRDSDPAEDWIEAAARVFADLDQKPEIGMLGWEDPIAGNFAAEGMAGHGPFFVPEVLLQEIASEDPNSLERTLGGVLAARSFAQKTALLAALERFPGEPTIISVALTNDLMRREELNTLVAALALWEEAEPENAFPTLARLELLEGALAPESREIENPIPLPPTALEDFANALRKPGWEDHSVACYSALLAIYREAGLAFVPLSMPLPNSTASHIYAARMAASCIQVLEAGDDAQAAMLLDLLKELYGRRRAAARSTLERVMATAMFIIPARSFVTHWEAHGTNEQAAAQLNQQLSDLREASKASFDPDSIIPAFLPIPSLSNAYRSGMSTDELGVLNRWARGRADAPVDQ